MLFELVTVSILICGASLLSVPSYITPCSLSDSQFENCSLTNAYNFIKNIQKGDPNLKISPITSMKLPILCYNNTKDFSVNITDLSLEGIDTLQILTLRKDRTKNRIEITVNFPNISAAGYFEVAATVGGRTVSGKGPGIWSYYNTLFNISFEWEPKERDGIRYTNIIKNDVEYKFGSTAINLKLDPGNDLNQVFNRNGVLVDEAIHSSVKYKSKVIINSITNELFTAVPYDELFLM